MDVPYLIHVPDGDKLWLVDGEQRLLITPRIYDLLASNGADLPPAYGIEELREQNTKLRELVKEAHLCMVNEGCCEDCYATHGECPIEMDMRELGVEVDE